MDATGWGVLIGTITLLVAIVARNEMRERRLRTIETEVKYLRRDLDQLLRMYRLTPIAEQEKRRR
jgi:hypothetical protein